jgi:hypothetical protein
VGCPRLLIQYIRSYPPCPEAVSSIRNLMTRHAVVTRDPLNRVYVKQFNRHVMKTVRGICGRNKCTFEQRRNHHVQLHSCCR